MAALLLGGCSTAPVSEKPPATPATTPAVRAEVKKVVPAEPETVQKPVAVSEANNIFFALRSTAVDEIGIQKLREHAERLKQNPKERVTLIGHMDDQGSRNYNLAITEERLMAVNSQLRAFGVPARQIQRSRTIDESGSTPCTTEACRAPMRRIELAYPE